MAKRALGNIARARRAIREIRGGPKTYTKEVEERMLKRKSMTARELLYRERRAVAEVKRLKRLARKRKLAKKRKKKKEKKKTAAELLVEYARRTGKPRTGRPR